MAPKTLHDTLLRNQWELHVLHHAHKQRIQRFAPHRDVTPRCSMDWWLRKGSSRQSAYSDCFEDDSTVGLHSPSKLTDQKQKQKNCRKRSRKRSRTRPPCPPSRPVTPVSQPTTTVHSSILGKRVERPNEGHWHQSKRVKFARNEQENRGDQACRDQCRQPRESGTGHSCQKHIRFARVLTSKLGKRPRESGTGHACQKRVRIASDAAAGRPQRRALGECPPEIVLKIAAELGMSDHKNLSLTCWSLRHLLESQRNDDRALVGAVRSGDIERVAEILQSAVRTVHGGGLVAQAAQITGNLEGGWQEALNMMELLLKAGANPNEKLSGGRSPLQIVVHDRRSGCRPMMHLLLERGARINLRDHHGLTALHTAVLSQNIEAVDVILSHRNCDVFLKTYTNEWNPFHYAAAAAWRSQNLPLIRLLQYLSRRSRCFPQSIALALLQQDRMGCTPLHIFFRSLQQYPSEYEAYEAQAQDLAAHGVWELFSSSPAMDTRDKLGLLPRDYSEERNVRRFSSVFKHEDKFCHWPHTFSPARLRITYQL